MDSLRGAIDRAIVWGNREPWLAARRLLWFFTFGWLLATIYLAAAVAMLASIIFAPFCYQAARLALLAADGGITLEPAADRFVLSLEVRGCVAWCLAIRCRAWAPATGPQSRSLLRVACRTPHCSIPSHPCGLPLLQAPAWGNPAHPYTIAANVVWVVLFGWSLAAMHLAAALVQAATIIGLGTAVTNVQLAMFAL